MRAAWLVLLGKNPRRVLSNSRVSSVGQSPPTLTRLHGAGYTNRPESERRLRVLAMVTNAGQGDHGFDVVGLREQVERLNRRHRVAEGAQFDEVAGQRGGVAGHVDDALGQARAILRMTLPPAPARGGSRTRTLGAEPGGQNFGQHLARVAGVEGERRQPVLRRVSLRAASMAVSTISTPTTCAPAAARARLKKPTPQ
jgi:hypothetical protein